MSYIHTLVDQCVCVGNMPYMRYEDHHIDEDRQCKRRRYDRNQDDSEQVMTSDTIGVWNRFVINESHRNTRKDILRFERRLKRYRLERYIQKRKEEEDMLKAEEGLTDHEDDHRRYEVSKYYLGATKKPTLVTGASMDVSQKDMKRTLMESIVKLQRENSILREAIRDKWMKDAMSNSIQPSS